MQDVSKRGGNDQKRHNLKSRLSGVTKKEDVIHVLETEIKSLISEQRALSKQALALKRSNVRLAELNQAKDEFIAVASHQLRTPATGVKQYIRLLLDGYGDPLTKDQSYFLEKAHESNDRQLKIIDDLLQVARIDAGNIRLSVHELDLSQMLDSLTTIMQHKAESAGQKIEFKKPAKEVLIKADAERLHMVFENIIDNAINYSQPKSLTEISITTSKDSVRVNIRDQGVGIKKSDFAKLFQKFSRIPNPLSIEVGGTGLGLYWAQKIAELHNGKITVKSKVGLGSTFTVTLPK